METATIMVLVLSAGVLALLVMVRNQFPPERGSEEARP